MLANDAFSRWLGIEVVSLSEGYCCLRMTVRDEMTNGFDVAHGGIAYALADSALAFAANTHGRHSMSIETTISHILPIHTNEILTAEAREEHAGNKIARYLVRITNQHKEQVASFKGTVYRSSQIWTINT